MVDRVNSMSNPFRCAKPKHAWSRAKHAVCDTGAIVVLTSIGPRIDPGFIPGWSIKRPRSVADGPPEPHFRCIAYDWPTGLATALIAHYRHAIW